MAAMQRRQRDRSRHRLPAGVHGGQLDGGDGSGLPNYVQNLTRSAVVMLEQVKNATGVDLAKLAEPAAESSPKVPKELG